MQSMTVGALVASLLIAAILLSVMTRFVASDIDGFRKWLDHADGTT